MKNSFEKRFQNYNFSEKLFSQEDNIIIGISGGPDSVALTRVLHCLQPKYKLQLHLVHINYGLRGKDSDRDEKFVEKLATELNLPLSAHHYKGKLVSEEALRNFRYAVFEKEQQKRKFDWIAVGHNKDDQVETVLLRLIRGAGIKGLGAMSAKRDRIIRPLLGFSRKEILAYLSQLKQAYRIDKTNLKTNYQRNRIRNKLLPLLEKEYNRAIKERLFDLAENLRADGQLVEEVSQKAYNKYVKENKGKLVLDQRVKELPAAVLRWIFRQALKQLSDLQNVSLANFKEFEKMLRSNKSKDKVLRIKGLIISQQNKLIIFRKEH